jgi:hypothetical protein
VASAEAAGCRVIAVPSLVPIPASPGRIVVSSLLDLRADANGIWVRGSGSPGSAAPEPSPTDPARLNLVEDPNLVEDLRDYDPPDLP